MAEESNRRNSTKNGTEVFFLKLFWEIELLIIIKIPCSVAYSTLAISSATATGWA